ncbi:hypothetical protein [Lysinibacillus sp. NPDC093688]|uniref:hypothetical protein n=1 Tax=Lysinibacillus sp. NPDC093688 TaxID=3390577 RepID=UPI003CFDA404
MKRTTIYLMLLVMVLIISACSSNSNNPENVKEEVWNDSIQYTLLMKDSLNNNEFLEGFNESINAFIEKYDKNSTIEEKEILDNLKELQKIYLTTKVIGISTGSPNTEKFDEQYQVMEEILGATNLEIKNYDKEKMAKKLAEYKE